MARIIIWVAILVMVFGCAANRKNTYRQYSVTTQLKHNDNFIQEVFGSSKTEYFVTGNFIIVQQNVRFLEDSIIHKVPKHAYYIVNTLSSKQDVVKIHTDFEAKAGGKDYEVFTKDSIERMFFFKGLLKNLELEKYKKENVNEETDYLVHSFAQKGANFNNKIAPDSIVLISSPKSDFPFHYLDFKNGQQIKQIEMYEKIEGGQFNALVMWFTKPTNRYQSATLDSILSKYKEKL